MREEFRQTRPFSPPDETHAAILRTAAVMQRSIAQIVDPSGVTIQQYNVLRILRSVSPDGMPTLAIRDQMVEEAAGITRLLDKLETAGYVIRERSTPDRRQVMCRITPIGLRVIANLDEPIEAANARGLSALSDADKRTLVELLTAVRAGYAEVKRV